MGLAASQARLLTITSRLADNELRSQTINNAKMRLATQSSQASDEYVSALNNAQLMFTNTAMDGTSQTQNLTFNTLTQYGPYNTQYGIVNSAGLIMVSEEDAKIFESSPNDLEGFLSAHGLKWSTTFFEGDGSGTDLVDKLTSFYASSDTAADNSSRIVDLYDNLDRYYAGLTNADLKKMYEQSISQSSSIEAQNYDSAAQNLYQETLKLWTNIQPELAKIVFGSGTSAKSAGDIANALIGENLSIDGLKQALITGSPNPAGAPGSSSVANYGLNNMKQYLTDDGYKDIKEFVDSFGYVTFGGHTYLSYATDSLDISDDLTPDTSDPTKSRYSIDGIIIDIPADGSTPTVSAEDSNETVTLSDSGNTYLTGCAGKSLTKEDIMNILNGAWITRTTTTKDDDGTTSTTNYYTYYQKSDDGQSLLRYEINPNENTTIKDFINEYLNYVSATRYVIDPQKFAKKYGTSENNLSDYLKAYNYFKEHYGEDIIQKALGAIDDNTTGLDDSNDDYLVDFDKFARNVDLSDYMKSAASVEGAGKKVAFSSVLNSYLVEKMLDVLGEPKYTWVDSTDTTSTGNADAKAQWYTNLFNRMQNGYKVLENGLAQSKEWMEYAFESGLVSMEQVDTSYNWTSLDYKSCSRITEETDSSSAVAVAEAKYQRAMNDIEAKDSIYDIELKNIDTEHSSLQQEYDSIKKAMDKNIERTMKFCQNG